MARGRPSRRLTKKAASIIASKRREIAALDDELFGEMVGVAQAIGELRKALTQLSASLDHREFEKASALGYGAVAAEFVFLQRTLGGLQGACLSKERLVSDVAYQLRCPYEEVLPQVDAIMQSSQPLSDGQRKKSRKARPRIRARVKALTQRKEQSR